MLFTLGISAQAQAAKVLTDVWASSDRIVKNSPFSAEAISEGIQTLADGNRIVHSSTSKLYRNSEGRFRSESPNGSGGLLGTTYSFAPSISILDPVAGQKYLLDERLKTAEQGLLRASTELKMNMDLRLEKLAPTAPLTNEQRMAIEKLKTEGIAAVAAAGNLTNEQRAAIEKARAEGLITATTAPRAMPVPPVPPTAVVLPDGPISPVFGVAVGRAFGGEPFGAKYETRTEKLGMQNFEGVQAEGTRTITTIPAGTIGNERPIEVVYERWYSNELQLVVMSKHSDPRSGEQTYRLTNINRSEPDPSLFSLPAGYRVVTRPTPTYRLSPAKAVAVERSATSVKATQTSAASVKNKP